MKTITEINRPTCKWISTEIEKLLKKFGDEHGLDVTPPGGSFSDGEYKARISFKVRANKDGQSADEITWRKYALLVGLEADDFGREFENRKERFKIRSLNINRKRPVLAERLSDGTLFQFDAAGINRILRTTVKVVSVDEILEPNAALKIGGVK